MPKPAKPSLSQNEVKFSSSSFASSSLDLTVATPSGLILQNSLIMALSLFRILFLDGWTSPDHQQEDSGFPRALEIMENLENHEKSSMYGKIMEFRGKKTEYSWKIHGIM